MTPEPWTMGKGEVSTFRLTLVLAGFFLVGGSMTFFIWHTLSDFLAGRPVEGGQYLLALALSGLFVALAWLLSHYVQRVLGFAPEGSNERPAGQDRSNASNEVGRD